MGTELSQLTFDYGDLAKSEVNALERHAKSVERITDKLRKTASEGAIALGRILKPCHDILANNKNGTFQKWVKDRCGITPKTAYNFIHAFEHFGNCETISQYIDATALYLLSADTCPEEATREAIKLAERGERITHKRAKELAEKYTVGDGPADDDESDDECDMDEPADYEWSLGLFILDTRKNLKRWMSKCPPEEIDQLAEQLEALAAQIRNKKGL